MTILRLQFVGLHEHLFVIVSMLTFGLMKLIATFDSGVTSEGRKTVSPKYFPIQYHGTEYDELCWMIHK